MTVTVTAAQITRFLQESIPSQQAVTDTLYHFFWVQDFFPENFLKKLKKYRCVFQCTLCEHLKINPTAPHQEIIRGWERIATLKEKGPLVREEHYGPADNVWL